jgi:hypothetical protein
MDQSFQSPRLTRSRTKPNLQVTQDQYRESLYALLVAEPPVLDLRSKLGPHLAKHPKQVTPGHLVSLQKLWIHLIRVGCKQLVLQSNKIKSSLFQLVHENNVLLQPGTAPLMIPVIIDDVKQHIMECASLMRSLKNDSVGSTRHYSLAAGLKHKMFGVHMQHLAPILHQMDFSELVLVPDSCGGATIPMLPPPKLLPGMPLVHIPWPLTTPTKSHGIDRQTTPEKLLLPDNSMGPEVMGTCSSMKKGLDQDINMAGVAVDDEGYPTIFGELIEGMQALQEDGVAVDDEGYPTIFGELLEGMQALQEDEVASGSAAGAAAAAAAGAVAPSVVAAAGAAEDTLPDIRPINPNVRARKLQVNAAAKQMVADNAAQGIAPTKHKKLKNKQPKKTNLKAQKIAQWDPQGKAKAKEDENAKDEAQEDDEPKKEDEPTLEEDEPKPKKIKDANAVILSAYGSSNADSGRFDIQGKCQFPDGSTRSIGILGFCTKEPYGEQVWKALLRNIAEASGHHTKGSMVKMKDEFIACCKQGLPC